MLICKPVMDLSETTFFLSAASAFEVAATLTDPRSD